MATWDDTRRDWNARPPTRPNTTVPHKSRTRRVWHWAGPATGLAGKPHSACLEMVRSWQAFHQSKGWKDIGYNGLVCPHARTIEGRGLAYSGSHSPGWNTTGWGVQFMVGEGERVSEAMQARAVILAQDLERLAGHDLLDAGHRDDPEASTSCPGPQIEAWVKAGGPERAPAPPEPAPPANVRPPDPITPPPLHPQPEGSPMYLVKLSTSSAVWLSDLITRRWVQSPAELSAVQAALKAAGRPTTVLTVKGLDAYGVPIGKIPAA